MNTPERGGDRCHNPCFSLKDEEDGLLGRVWGERQRGETVSEGNERAHRSRTTQLEGGWMQEVHRSPCICSVPFKA